MSKNESGNTEPADNKYLKYPNFVLEEDKKLSLDQLATKYALLFPEIISQTICLDQFEGVMSYLNNILLKDLRETEKKVEELYQEFKTNYNYALPNGFYEVNNFTRIFSAEANLLLENAIGVHFGNSNSLDNAVFNTFLNCLKKDKPRITNLAELRAIQTSLILITQLVSRQEELQKLSLKIELLNSGAIADLEIFASLKFILVSEMLGLYSAQMQETFGNEHFTLQDSNALYFRGTSKDLNSMMVVLASSYKIMFYEELKIIGIDALNLSQTTYQQATKEVAELLINGIGNRMVANNNLKKIILAYFNLVIEAENLLHPNENKIELETEWINRAIQNKFYQSVSHFAKKATNNRPIIEVEQVSYPMITLLIKNFKQIYEKFADCLSKKLGVEIGARASKVSNLGSKESAELYKNRKKNRRPENQDINSTLLKHLEKLQNLNLDQLVKLHYAALTNNLTPANLQIFNSNVDLYKLLKNEPDTLNLPFAAVCEMCIEEKLQPIFANLNHFACDEIGEAIDSGLDQDQLMIFEKSDNVEELLKIQSELELPLVVLKNGEVTVWVEALEFFKTCYLNYKKPIKLEQNSLNQDEITTIENLDEALRDKLKDTKFIAVNTNSNRLSNNLQFTNIPNRRKELLLEYLNFLEFEINQKINNGKNFQEACNSAIGSLYYNLSKNVKLFNNGRRLAYNSREKLKTGHTGFAGKISNHNVVIKFDYGGNEHQGCRMLFSSETDVKGNSYIKVYYGQYHDGLR